MSVLTRVVLPVLLLSSTAALAQMGGGGMGGHPGGGWGRGAGAGMRRMTPAKPLSRERFDKVVTAMFREADANHDGTLTIDELRGIIEGQRDAIIRARFARIDSNHDRAISEEEFFAWQRQMGSVASSESAGMGEADGPVAEVIRPQLGDDPEDRMIGMMIEPLGVTVLTQANSNYDAGVSLAELIAFEGQKFQAADTDHDGWVTMEEMRAAMPRRGPRRDNSPAGCPTGETC